MGRIATTSLLQLINGDRVKAHIPPLELVVRETTRRLR
jgi:LacI family transcriptional regulator